VDLFEVGDVGRWQMQDKGYVNHINKWKDEIRHARSFVDSWTKIYYKLVSKNNVFSM
jgi:hypothetical protein